MSDLPPTWFSSNVGTLYDVIGGGTPSTAEPSYWGVGTDWITSADIYGIRDVQPSKKVTLRGVSSSATNVVPAGTILVVTRVGLGKVAVAPTEIAFSQDVQGLVARNDAVDPKFALQFLHYALGRLKYEGRGTTISGITKKQLKDLAFPVPPRSEQVRILAKVEELLSELDDCVRNLATALRQLKVYRQAILKKAFEGKLTDCWRTQQSLSSSENAADLPEAPAEHTQNVENVGNRKRVRRSIPALTDSEREKLPSLPSTWSWVRLASLFESGPRNGLYKPASFYGSGTNIIRIDDFYEGRLVRIAGFKRVALDADEVSAFAVRNGDIIVNRVNSIEYLGKCALVDALEEDFVFESNIMNCGAPNASMQASLLVQYLSSEVGRRRLCSNAKHAVNQASINQVDVGSTPVPLPPLAEQAAIAGVLDNLLSQVDRMAEDVAVQIKKASALRQSVLKRAFSGKLVAQHLSDEPASSVTSETPKAKEGDPTKRRRRNRNSKKEAA
jgi:type I restriction enzyme, S subunit